MKYFSVTAVIATEDNFEGRKPDLNMITALLREKLGLGEVKEKVFRQNVILNIKDVHIMGYELTV